MDLLSATGWWVLRKGSHRILSANNRMQCTVIFYSYVCTCLNVLDSAVFCREQAELAKLFYMEMATDLQKMNLKSRQIAQSLRRTEEDMRTAAKRRKTSSMVFLFRICCTKMPCSTICFVVLTLKNIQSNRKPPFDLGPGYPLQPYCAILHDPILTCCSSSLPGNMAERLSVLAPVVGVGAGLIVGTISSLSAFLAGTAGVISGLWGTHQSKQLHCEEIALNANADIAHKSVVLMEVSLIALMLTLECPIPQSIEPY